MTTESAGAPSPGTSAASAGSAAIINARRTNNSALFLTTLGGRAFGNRSEWILGALRRALNLYCDCSLDIEIVSYRSSNPHVQRVVQDYNQTRSRGDSA